MLLEFWVLDRCVVVVPLSELDGVLVHQIVAENYFEQFVH